uniref:FAD/NAD(P)-binding domain-containing protein n=2 Tax=Entomoneis paludosa TaxID=265537 RepID=A0A7S2YPK6_9STRA|mmetsp:Transcript_4763/g.10136  ORF Transcript_4763/g.10136 Transcript_4763/m.10136 type:complete len:386 (+) Transcript_4763:406-1563(+)
MVIVGGGPAGWSAAIYGARAGLTPLVIAPSMGGQLQGKGVDVENYPGLAETATGPALVAAMRHQALHFGATVEDDIVTAIEPPANGNGPLKIMTNGTGTIEAHTIIVATGAEANWLQVPGEWELRGGGVSSCATCDGFLYAKKSVIVVGGGDAAMEDALVLARTSSKVTVIHRRDQFRASKVLADRVLNHPVIDVVWNATVEEIVGQVLETDSESEEVEDLDQQQKVVKSAIVKDVTSGATTAMECDAVFVAIGHTPSTSFLKGVVEFDPEMPGYIQTTVGTTATSVAGLFAAGDVADAVYRQAITSAGSGAAAALDAERYLSENGLGNEQEEFEAELLAELMSDGPSATSASSAQDEDAYNVYADDSSAANAKQFAKESVRAEL